MTWKFGMSLLSWAEIFAKKKGSFDDATWKFKLPLLSQGKMSTKVRLFLYIHLKIWPAHVITSWNFRKNKTVLLKWFGNLNCFYYLELKFSQKYARLNEVNWIFKLPLLSRRKLFRKIKAVLLLRFKNLNCRDYH